MDFQFWDDRSWQSYGASEQRELNRAMQTPQREVVLGFRVVQHLDQVHMGLARQRNNTTGNSRWVRIKPPYQLGGTAPNLPPQFHFCYEDDHVAEQWHPFDQELQQELSACVQCAPPPAQVFFKIRNQEYVLLGLEALLQDVNADLTQVNLMSNRMRRAKLRHGVAPAPAASRGRPSLRRGPSSSSSYSAARGSLASPAPAFSLASAIFLVMEPRGRRRLSPELSEEVIRQWRELPRPSQVVLSDGSVLENFQALEGGLAMLQSRDGCSRQKLEVRFDPWGAGSLQLPADLDQDTSLDLSSVGKSLTSEETFRICRTSDKECSICSEELAPTVVPTWAACKVDEDGDVDMESNAASSSAGGAGNVIQLPCGHVYHTKCLKKWFDQRASCPLCLREFGKVVGTQPSVGSFEWKMDSSVQLPGHNAKSAIVIQFDFPPGTDGDGRPYPGRRERGYLPYNCQGIIQLELFKVAFRRRVMFGLGASMASGKYKPTFNIHIKTKPRGGATQHGYPDPDYFHRSLDELKSMGITLADLP